MSKCFYRIEKEGQIILYNVKSADSFIDRFFGLMMKKGLGKTDGLLLKPCKQIHSFMMRFAIDAIFLSRENEIIYLENNMVKNKITPYIMKADSILEVDAGFIKKTELKIGDKLNFERSCK